MGTKKQIILFLYVLAICVFAGSEVRADTIIPYELNNGWTYGVEYSETLELTENPAGGIIASIDIPTDIVDGGLQSSRHDLPDYSLYNEGFIQLEYSSFSSEITGNPEGLSLCLEIEFYNINDVFYEIAISIEQDDEGFSFGTWFGSYPDSTYLQTLVPNGLSLAEGALGLYSDGSLVLPYFIDATGSVLFPFDAWDISGIIGTYGYRVDNDFEGETPDGGTIIASVNLEQVVYGPGAPEPQDPISDHVFKIEISKTNNYYLGDLLYYEYEFDAWLQVDETVASVVMETPGGVEYIMIFVSDGFENEFGFNAGASDPSVLDALFGIGTYTFTVNYQNGSSDSTSIGYQLPGGGPIPRVTQQPKFTYPQHNAVEVPLNCTLEFDSAINPDHTIGVWIYPSDGNPESLSYSVGELPYNTSSYGPIILSPNTLYKANYEINNAVFTLNTDGIPTVMDTDAETQIHFTTVSPVVEEPIEEILDLIDESVEDGTLSGNGPGKSGGNRLNALINMLEEAQSLIESGLYEEACDQLWSAYRKCDGEPNPPDFVTGEAAEDLAEMILFVMNELGC